MRSLAILLLASCGAQANDLAEACHDDPTANHRAVNPSTGECWEFTSSCDVPPTWEACPVTMSGIPARVCTGDTECPRYQHCVVAADGSGSCADNDPCISTVDCPEGTECGPSMNDQACDPADPGCIAVVPTSLCIRPPAPCTFTIECAPGDVCPIEYLPDAPATCAFACVDDTTCQDGTRCNTDQVCAQPQRLLPLCYGWCIPITP